MENNPTVGYSFGILEGYLEALIKENQAGAEDALGYLKVIENAYIEKARLLAEADRKLVDIQMNLNGWSRN
jgi:hypothetical protein